MTNSIVLPPKFNKSILISVPMAPVYRSRQLVRAIQPLLMYWPQVSDYVTIILITNLLHLSSPWVVPVTSSVTDGLKTATAEPYLQPPQR